MSQHREKLAIITGASRGIGRTVALDLAKQGYNMALVAKSSDNLKLTQKEIIKSFPEVKTDIHAIDVAKRDSVNECVNHIMTKYEHIDILFNNAAIYERGGVDIDPVLFDRVLDV